jgi:hypothetical protein
MNKLKLRVEDIAVAGFETLRQKPAGRGTVQGAELISRYTACNQETCWVTCDAATCLC